MGGSRLISIAEAAKQFNLSRRTVERWIRDGLLASEVSEQDRRVRLVSATEVEALVRQRVRPKEYRTEHAQHPTASATNNGHQELDAQDRFDYQATIDTTLQRMYAAAQRVISQLYPPASVSLTLGQLREGPLGQDLQTLADLAHGKRRMMKGQILAGVESILQVLFWPAATDDYAVPREFWETDLGRLVGRVKRQAYDPEELMSIGAAAEALGVSRGTVYEWLDDRTLDFVPDEATGRTLVIRRSVAERKRDAAESAGVSVYERGKEKGDAYAARPVATRTE